MTADLFHESSGSTNITAYKVSLLYHNRRLISSRLPTFTVISLLVVIFHPLFVSLAHLIFPKPSRTIVLCSRHVVVAAVYVPSSLGIYVEQVKWLHF
jgi:hypothetical protein